MPDAACFLSYITICSLVKFFTETVSFVRPTRKKKPPVQESQKLA